MNKFTDTSVIVIGILLIILWDIYGGAGGAVSWVIAVLLAVAIAYVAYFIVYKRLAKRAASSKGASANTAQFNADFPDQTLNDIFASFFGESSADYVVNIKLTRAEAAQGCVKVVPYAVRKPCDTCDGTGEAVRGSSPICTACNGEKGKGQAINTILGTFTTTRYCETCNGRGVIINNPCRTCNAAGYNTIQERAEITIPPNCAEQTMTLEGKGGYIDKHNRGNLIIHIKR